MPTTANSIILKRTIPSGQPVTQDVFGIRETVLPELSDGQVLLRTIVISVDPVQRTLLSGAKHTMLPSYVPEQPITGFAIARVVESRRPEFNVGDLVEGLFDWSDYVIWDGEPSAFVRSVDSQIPKPSYALGILGITGLTAYFGIVEVGNVQKGETVVISSAAGAVGSVAGMIAKVRGAKVIGLTSSQAKQDVLIQKLGFDFALNYTADDFADQLYATTSGKLDVYFDSVGGQLSQTIMKQMKRPARVVECGQISTYNDDKYAWMMNVKPIHMNGLRLEGFQPMLFKDKWPEALDQLQKWILSGDLVPLETEMKGLEYLPKALTALLDGENIGKMLVMTEV